MKIAFATVLSNGYVVFFDHLIKSILKHNPKFNKDFYIFYTDADCRVLSEPNHEHLKKLYPKVKFKKVDFKLYEKHNKWQLKYYSFESFTLKGYDKVVFMDCDMLCLNPLDTFYKDIKEIVRLGMVKEIHRACYNGGLIVIDKSYISDEVYNELLKFNIHLYPDVFGHDQKVYNVFFNNKIQKMERKYNIFVGEGVSEKTIFSHYIHKPNSAIGRKQLNKVDLERWDYYDDSKGRTEGIIT